MSYSVYVVAYLGGERDHHAIFIETEPDESGFIFQVSGSIQIGMEFNHKRGKKPDESITFVSKSSVGTVSKTDYDRIQPIVESIPPPKKQFDKSKRIDPSVPLRRCQEWTAEAVQALKDHGVLQDNDGDIEPEA